MLIAARDPIFIIIAFRVVLGTRRRILSKSTSPIIPVQTGPSSNCAKHFLEDHPFRFLVHDRDSILSRQWDQSLTAMGVRVQHEPEGPVSRRRFTPRRPKQSIDIAFRKAVECAARLCWVTCITNTGWKRSRYERVRNCFAEQTGHLGLCGALAAMLALRRLSNLHQKPFSNRFFFPLRGRQRLSHSCSSSRHKQVQTEGHSAKQKAPPGRTRPVTKEPQAVCRYQSHCCKRMERSASGADRALRRRSPSPAWRRSRRDLLQRS